MQVLRSTVASDQVAHLRSEISKQRGLGAWRPIPKSKSTVLAVSVYHPLRII